MLDVKGDGERALLVFYGMKHETCWLPSSFVDGRCPHLNDYLAVFLFRWAGDGYRVSPAGNFFEGAVHAVTQFGPDPSDSTIFIRFQCCKYCEPTIFLSVFDFNADQVGTVFEFTYAADHDAWETVIEYRLPGMGHSVDAVTETRVPAPHGQTGPHLMQIFDIEDGVDEWWLFRCRAHRCDYELFETDLPPRYRAIWESALRL